jgi:hypothetical protein
MLNKILNDALLNEGSFDEYPIIKTNSSAGAKELAFQRQNSTGQIISNPMSGYETLKHGATDFWRLTKTKASDLAQKATEKFNDINQKHPNALKYAGAGAVALGAGVGALALAKKLRAKKAEAKAGKSKKD